MSHPKFDRSRLFIRRLSERKNTLSVKKNMVPENYQPGHLPETSRKLIGLTADRIIESRKNGKPVILAFGAHVIKNGLSPVIIRLIREGWITHLATNGAGIIHDWEFAYQGETGEDVRANVAEGKFGIWEETGLYINLAIIIGAYEGLGYGEAIGKLISRERLDIPESEALISETGKLIMEDPERAAAALDLLGYLKRSGLKAGFLDVPHPFKKFSVQAAAYDLKIPFTGHPMIGHDIIYNHPANNGAAIGRSSINDFLSFAHTISNIEGGVYLSVGSAIMSPMIFEKALSMAQNVAIQEKKHIDNHFMLIADLAENRWNWAKDGEPPADNPAYYLRYCKTFSRMGGEMHYLTADNRDFLTALLQGLSVS
jgi:hypothetical protein